MAAPKISIIMSNYNCHDFIEETIKSVLAQTFKDFEFIIIDDCSTDDSRDIIDQFTDPRIKRYYFEKNEHMCYAFNYAISKAKGNYYARIDSDDTWLPNKLEQQVNYMEANKNCGACFTLITVVDENNNPLTNDQSDRVGLLETHNRSQAEWLRKFYFEGSCLCHPSVLMRKSTIDEVGPYNYSLVQIQDYELWVRIAKKYDIYVIQERLTNYRWFLTGRNASAPSPAVNTRSEFEFTYVLSRYFDDIPDELFIEAFGKDFVAVGTTDHDELLCERALLLLRSVFCGNRPKLGGMEKLIDLLQNEKTRNILRNKYNITQKNFYELSASPVFYSDEMMMEIDYLRQELTKKPDFDPSKLNWREKLWIITPRPLWNICSKCFRLVVKRK